MREGRGVIRALYCWLQIMKIVRLPPKRIGEAAELAFMHRAAELGLTVLKPYGDSARFDVVLFNGRRFLKIQVKSACRRRRDGIISIPAFGSRNRPYRRGEVDFIAAYLRDEQAWFIVPARDFLGHLMVYIGKRSPRHLRFRENWRALL